MDHINSSEWRGPYKSRAEFETFQDECIAQLVTFAQRRPLYTDNPDYLQDQLGTMGKFVPAAFLGLGRYNPAVTELIIYGEHSGDIRTHDFSKGPFINNHGYHTGEAAYERMVNDWHDFDSWTGNHRFDVKSIRETAHELHAIVWAGKASLVGYWNFNNELQTHCSESVDIPDTSHAVDSHVEWTQLTAFAGDGDIQTRVGYTAAPFPAPDRPPKPISESAVLQLGGESALRAFQEYGVVGLYQQRLWHGMRQLIAGVSTGPNVTM